MPELLFETQANPIPAGMRSGLLAYETNGSKHPLKSLRYALLQPENRTPRGTVILLQGRNEFIEKYFETMSELAERGFVSATFDWRGQGGSHRLLRDRHRGYVHRFSDYGDDLIQFLHEIVLRDSPPPYYILGHSAGALVALATTDRLAPHIQRMVLSAPFMGLPKTPLGDATIRRMASSLRLLGLGRLYASGGKRFLTRPFEGNLVTSDPVRFARNVGVVSAHPELALGGPTIRWLWGALETARKLDAIALTHQKFAIPTLIVAAGAERVVSTPALQRFATNAPHISLMTIDGALHELLQEADPYRTQFWSAFDDFLTTTDPI